MNSHHPIPQEWSSKWSFILAATGAAVGLGNIWKFPYIAGENGGGAFVLIYLACVLVAGLPIMIAEILIGRRARKNPVSALYAMAAISGTRFPKMWRLLGVCGILAGAIILSYYSVIAGWACDYALKAATGIFEQTSPIEVQGVFAELVSNPYRLLFWHSFVMFATVFVVAKGVQRGLEPAVKLLMPGMLILMFVLICYAINSGYFMHGVNFLFHPNFAKITPDAVLNAMGHAFFTLSIAIGTVMTYGAYLPRTISISQASFLIAGADTIVALLAGMIIFPVVFANSLTPGAGPGLIFETLPIAFSAMPMTSLFATLFFVMLVFAAFTSAISLLEPSVSWAIETFNMSRPRAALVIGFLLWFLGIGSLLAFNHWQDIKYFGLNFFEGLDYLTANIMLPISGLFIAIFVGFIMKREHSLDELQVSDGLLFRCWLFVLRYITPLAITGVMLYSLKILRF